MEEVGERQLFLEGSEAAIVTGDEEAGRRGWVATPRRKANGFESLCGAIKFDTCLGGSGGLLSLNWGYSCWDG